MKAFSVKKLFGFIKMPDKVNGYRQKHESSSEKTIVFLRFSEKFFFTNGYIMIK